MRDRAAGKEAEWITVTDGQYTDDKPQFSPDGNTVYFPSTRDGYLCIWAQKLDPATKRPVGNPLGYEHFHSTAGGNPLFSMELNVARDKIPTNIENAHSDIWMTQLAPVSDFVAPRSSPETSETTRS